jgi:hypothetical protein
MQRILLIAVLGAALSAALVPAALALDRRVRIVNDSHYRIIGFYATNAGLRDWRDSLLGEGEIVPGASLVMNFDDGSGYCRFRFSAVFEDGVALERGSVDVCRVGTYRYTD